MAKATASEYGTGNTAEIKLSNGQKLAAYRSGVIFTSWTAGGMSDPSLRGLKKKLDQKATGRGAWSAKSNGPQQKGGGQKKPPAPGLFETLFAPPKKQPQKKPGWFG